jgi:hypothetical protein
LAEDEGIEPSPFLMPTPCAYFYKLALRSDNLDIKTSNCLECRFVGFHQCGQSLKLDFFPSTQNHIRTPRIFLRHLFAK